MKQFLLNVLSTCIGVLVAFFFMTVVTVAGLIAVAGVAAFMSPVSGHHAVLHVKLNHPVSDRHQANARDELNLGSQHGLGLNAILAAIDLAADDKDMHAIYLDLSHLSVGMATIQELRQALLHFRKTSHKPVIAYADSYSQGAYYLASAADKIYLNPQGEVDLHGLAAQVLFLKGALDKLGIEAQVVRHGKFKSAIEPFVATQMSPENRKQTAALVDSIWRQILDEVGTARALSLTDLQRIADHQEARFASAALGLKLVDQLRYEDEVLAELRTLSGAPQEDDFDLVRLHPYAAYALEKREESTHEAKIAVVYAEGEIVDGKGDEQNVGSKRFAKALREAREDDEIKAVVLRINSPGGSALASESIWREVSLLKDKKPLIVSMGDVAASGGYYIAAPAQRIYAQPTTITGSIGVFGLMFNAQKLMNEHLGIFADVVKSAEYADMDSPFKPLRPEERALLQSQVEKTYDVFVTRVAEGRKMEKSAVDEIGQGRVWSGVAAQKIGLVDELGGLFDAIQNASRQAKIEHQYTLIELPEQQSALESFIAEFSDDVDTKLTRALATKLPTSLTPALRALTTLKKLEQTPAVQMRMPSELQIQ